MNAESYVFICLWEIPAKSKKLKRVEAGVELKQFELHLWGCSRCLAQQFTPAWPGSFTPG